MSRRHNDPQTPHERARTLGSDRLDMALTVDDAAWLERHLASCPDCAAVVEAYARDRRLLRSMPAPEAPRDLWARTSVALDRERGRRVSVPAARSRLPRWEAAAAILAVLVVGVLVGRTLMPVGRDAVDGSGQSRGDARSGADRLRGRRGDPDRRPAGRGRLGRSIVGRFVRRERGQRRRRLRPGHRSVLGLRAARHLGSADHLAQGTPGLGGPRTDRRPGGRRRHRERRDRWLDLDRAGDPSRRCDRVAEPRCQSDPGWSRHRRERSPDRGPVAQRLADADRGAEPDTGSVGRPVRVTEPERPGLGRTVRVATPSASSSPTATPSVSAPPSRTPSPVATPSVATPTDTPAPTLARALAIISDVVIVGGAPIYSPDGEWLAFSARPAHGRTGPGRLRLAPGRCEGPAAHPRSRLGLLGLARRTSILGQSRRGRDRRRRGDRRAGRVRPHSCSTR